MTPDRDPNHLYQAFREKLANCHAYLQHYLDKRHPGLECRLIEGFRTTARQQELYAIGRTVPGKIVTYKNGTTTPSNHQTCLAADTGIFDSHGQYIEEPPQDVWDQLRHAAHENGLVSGGDWTGGFKDWPHLESPTSDKATYKAAAVWKRQQGLI